MKIFNCICSRPNIFILIIFIPALFSCDSNWDQLSEKHDLANGPHKLELEELKVSLVGLVQNSFDLMAVGIDGSVSKSRDNGQSWKFVVNGTNLQFKAVGLTNIGLVALGGYRRNSDDFGDVGSNQIIRLKNEQTWQTIYGGNQNLNAIAAKDNVTVAVGINGTVVRSKDNLIWNQVPLSINQNLNAVSWVGSDLIAVGGGFALDNNRYEGDSELDEATIIRSEDSGESWSVIHSHVTGALRAIVTKNNNLVAVGDGGLILLSDNAGKSWRKVKNDLETDVNLNAIAWEGKVLVAVGEEGLILRSTDEGRTWSTIKIDTDEELNAVLAVSGEFIASGSKGKIFRSAKQGTEWKLAHNNIDNFLHVLSNTNAIAHQGQVLVSVGGDGIIERSWNGGLNWEKIYQYTNEYFSDISLVGDTVVAVGTKGKIVYLQTGNQKPEDSMSPTDQSLNAVVQDDKTVIAVGDTGTVIRSARDSKNWSVIPSKTNHNLNALARNGKDIVAVGSHFNYGIPEELQEGAIIRSEDDGFTWEPIREINENLNDVAWYSNEVIAVGDKGAIFHSRDRGQTWQAIESVTNQNLNSVERKGLALATSGQSVTLASVDGGKSWRKFSVGGSIISGDFELVEAFVFIISEDSIFRLRATEPLPLVNAASVRRDLDGRNTIALEIDFQGTSCGENGAEVSIKAQTDQNWVDNITLKEIGSAAFKPGQTDYNIPINLQQSLGLTPGEEFRYSVDLSCDGWVLRYPLKGDPIKSVYQPWYQRLMPWQWFFISQAVFAGLTLMIYVVRPLWIANFYRASTRLGPLFDTKIPLIDLKLAELLQFFNLWGVSFLVRRPRVLDAWVSEHAAAWQERFELEPTVRRCQGYFPLPCRLQWHENEQVIPTEELVTKLFDDKANVCQLVGVGGSGKTMLTIQLCRWAMQNPAVNDRIKRLPILIEEDTLDLLLVIKRKLRAMNIEEDEGFLIQLLKKGRLMPVFDRLSERSVSTVEYVCKINGYHALGALLISSRHQFDFDGGYACSIVPLELGPDFMMSMICALLERREDRRILSSMAEQTELAQKLAALIQYQGNELKVTPLLVTLFVKRALRLSGAGKPLSDLPTSIPDAYFAYLRDINPKDPGDNRLNDEEMLIAAKKLAVLSVSKNYVPQDFPLEKGRKAMVEAGWVGSGNIDPIKRLVSNGVIVIRDSGPRDMIAFALDPVAEFLAAAAFIESYEFEPEKKDALLQHVSHCGLPAKGFLLALELTSVFYSG